VVSSGVANGLAYLRVQDGDTFALHRLQHFTSAAKKPSVSLVVDVCGEGLADVATYMEDAFESDAFAAAPAPALDVSLVAEGPPPTKANVFLEQKDHEEVRREAEKEAAFEADMEPSRQLHEEGHLAKDAVEAAGLLEQLEQPAAEKAKKAPTGNCEHGRRKSRCKDCGTGYCTHGRVKNKCKDCGTGYCKHGRRKSRCKDCGTGHCQHGRQKSKCMDCGTGHCQHGRQKNRCKDCGTGHCQHGCQKKSNRHLSICGDLSPCLVS
jgi:hypothetical protein